MLFNSYAFGLFFPVVTTLYFLTSGVQRRWLLLFASSLFYAWAVPAYLGVLALLIGVDYGAARLMEPRVGRSRKAVLAISLVANLALLGGFKYSQLLLNSGLWLLGREPLELGWQLPVGLSFHTFQAMSYTLEVYRGRIPAERNLAIYALYVMFYPQLVAGPIERPQQLLPQLRLDAAFEERRVVEGLQQMAWGLFKKVAVADRLAAIVNPVYALPVASQGPTLLLATLCFSLQIYCDFSGYSDIAIGAARVMGIRLQTNFRRPYLATSLRDFWRRWHISLSSWFRDYLYRPLGGRRGGGARTALCVLTVFGLSGLWHGARWSFLLWGLIHGLAMLLQDRLLGRRSGPGWSLLGWATTQLLVTLCWIPFRAENWQNLREIVGRLPTGWGADRLPQLGVVPLESLDYLATSLAVAVLLAVEGLQETGRARGWLTGLRTPLRWSLYYAWLVALLLLAPDSMQPFYYFQF